MEFLLAILYEKFRKNNENVFDLNNNGLSYWENRLTTKINHSRCLKKNLYDTLKE